MTGIVYAEAGESVYSVIQRAIEACNKTQQEHFLEMNDTRVRVYPGSHEFDIAEKWSLTRQLNNSKRLYEVFNETK